VYLVNALHKPYTVRVNGQPYTLQPRSAPPVRVPEGDVAVQIMGADAAVPAETGQVRTWFFGRPFSGATFVVNPDHAQGLSTSLRAGLEALPAEAAGAVVCLGDMPRVSASLIDGLIAAFDPAAGRRIVVPTWRGQRGNPVLWSRELFPAMQGLTGDIGARQLILQHADAVTEVEAGSDATLIDIDTPEALAAYAEADR